MVRNLLAAAVVLAFTLPAAAQPDPKKPDDKRLVTKVYDLRPALGERGKANGLADMDAVIKMILETLPVSDLKPGADGPQLVERDGYRLEVRAPAKLQAEIGDLIAAVVRLADLAVDVEAKVIELDAAAFEKLTKSFPETMRVRPGSPVVLATGAETEEREPTAEEKKVLKEVNQLLKSGKVVQTSTARFANGAEAIFSARQSVLTFHNNVVNAKPAGPPQFVKEGFRLVGVPVVSADRRFVRLKLTEQSAAFTRMRKVEIKEVVDKQDLVLQSPELEDLGGTGSATVADGGTVLFRLRYAPKDKVWVVVLHPRIFIRAEEDELKKQEKK